ncbi:MAG: ABC transporter permease [Christensenellales bacterium]|jgi:peptide/nickel transport system permease protein
MKKIWNNTSARFKIGFVAVGILVICAFILTQLYTGPNIIEYNTYKKNLPISSENLLGTTALGQDTFWMLMFSLRNSIMIGVIVGVFGTVVGVLYGLIAGFVGGALDRVMMTISDTFIVIPSLPVLILMTALMSGSLTILPIALVLSLFAWAHPARHVRAMCLSMRERDFISTARFSGEGILQIVVTEILPYLLTWSLSNFMNAILVAIGQESSLAVLGLSSSNLPTLGNMIKWARDRNAILGGRWLWVGSPIVTTMVLFISLFMLITGYNEYISKKRGRL